MANSNNICTRFINYFALLILLFLSSSVFAAGGSFSGGGASGSWPEPPKQCKDAKEWRVNTLEVTGAPTPTQSCEKAYKYYSTPTQDMQYQHANQDANGIWYCPSPQFGSYSRGASIQEYPVVGYDPTCEDKCPAGYEKDANGKCQPKKCPVGQTLVNGQCKQKQCPAGQALDSNGNCMPRDDQCPAGQKMVNGRCITPPPDDPNEPDDPNSEWPPFCEWASVMCQWHQEWQQWSNDYAANEQKADLDREVIKDLIGESVLRLDDIKTKMDQHKITIDEIKNQDKQFYDELRLWLNNFDSSNGNPSEQNPSIEFPPFCDWSVQVCNWYLDWKDWRTDYNANNALVIEKYNQYLQRLDEIKAQDKQFYDDFESYASAVTLNQEKDFEQNKDFYDEIRDFFDWYKDQSEQNPNDPNDPSNPENQDGDVSVAQQEIPFNDSQRITFVNGCPAGEQFTVSFMGSTQNLEFSYQPLCQFMTMIRPFVIAIAYLIGAYILMGLSRGSSE